MGRFFLILLVALGIAGGLAYYNNWGPFEPAGADEQNLPGSGGHPSAVREDLGKKLYELQVPANSWNPIEDDQPSLRAVRFHEFHFVPVKKQDLSAGKDGIVVLVGEPVFQEDPKVVKNPDARPSLNESRELQTVDILVGGKKREITFRPLQEGDVVEHNQVVALVDPTKALNDIEFKKAKIVASQADHLAAVAMANEAKARLDRLEQLKRQGPGLVSAEDYSAAVLTRDKHREEAVSKREQIKLSEIELQQAVAELRQHEIRCTLPSKSIVKQIYKVSGEGVKNLEAVVALYNISQLRAEGAVGAQYADSFREGMKVVLEPSQEMDSVGDPLKSHRGEITGVAIARDGTLASGSEDQTVCLWRPGQRLPVRELRHSAAVRSVACTPKGAALNVCAAGLSDGRIVLWDLDKIAEGKGAVTPAKEFKEGHGDPVTALAFSSDGKYLASGGQDNQIVLWDVADLAKAERRYRFDLEHGVDRPHQGMITALTFTPEGKLISAARDNTIRVWQLREKGALLEGEPEERRGGAVAVPGVSPDGKLLIHDQGGKLQLRSVDERQPRGVLETTSAGSQFETVALFSPDGSLLLTAGAPEGRLQRRRTPSRKAIKQGDKVVEVRESRPFEVRQFVPRDRTAVTCAAFSPDGTFAVSGNKRGDVYVWKVPTRDEVKAHRIRWNLETVLDAKGRRVQQENRSAPLTLTHVDRALDASRIRLGVQVDNSVTPDPSTGRLTPRLRPGQRVTVVAEP